MEMKPTINWNEARRQRRPMSRTARGNFIAVTGIVADREVV
jgi:hypothetical protein